MTASVQARAEQLARTMVREILDNDSDGAKESFAILLGMFRQHDVIPHLGDAVYFAHKERK